MDQPLVAWRLKAANIFLAASAFIHLVPVVLFGLFGFGPPATSLAKIIVFLAWVVLAVAALLRRVDYRARLCAYFLASYLVVGLSDIASPRGPYAQLGLVVNPVLVLVLCGSAAARVAILASTTILVSAPFLRELPGLDRALGFDSVQLGSPGLLWFQAIGVAAILAALMVLFDGFHRFLMDALDRQYRAKADLQREIAERTAAQQKVEEEMLARQRLERELTAVGDKERRRLGRDLHDGVCQQVTAALLRCQTLERRLERGESISGADFAPLTSLLAETIDDAHNVALGLCPLEPHPEALAPALRALARQIQEMAGVRCEFIATGDVRVPDPATAQHLFRIAQEALNNAVRHAHAGRITVELRGIDHELTLHVQDDGGGLPPDLPNGGMGLRTMAYRARVLEGELTVGPAPGRGTRVAFRVRCPAKAYTGPADEREKRWIPAT